MNLPLRRFFRFSLGTLFIVVSMLCAFLAIMAQRVLPQQRAVAAILEAGGQVKYDTDSTSWPREKLAALLGNDWFYSVRSVSLSGERCNDATVQYLRNLPDVSSLSLWPWYKNPNDPLGGISDESMKVVASLPKLERVTLQANSVSDAGLGYLRKHPRIKEVEVR